MNFIAFNTQTATKRLRGVGFEEPQAEEIVSLMIDVSEAKHSEMATMAALDRVETKLSAEIERVETKLTGDIKSLEEKLVAKIASSQLTATRWLIGAMFTLAALVFTAVKFID